MISLASELSTFLILTSLTVMLLSGIWAIGTLYLQTEKLYSSATLPSAKIVIEDFYIDNNILNITLLNDGSSSVIISQENTKVHILYYAADNVEYKVYSKWTIKGENITSYELLPGAKVVLNVKLDTMASKDCILDVILTSRWFRVEWTKKF